MSRNCFPKPVPRLRTVAGSTSDMVLRQRRNISSTMRHGSVMVCTWEPRSGNPGTPEPDSRCFFSGLPNRENPDIMLGSLDGRWYGATTGAEKNRRRNHAFQRLDSYAADWCL